MDALNEISLPTVLVTAAAIISPYLTAIFTRTGMSPKVKNIIAVVVSVVLALGYTLLKGDVTDWDTFWTAVPAIYATSQLMYVLFMKNGAKKVEEKYGITAKPADEKPVGGGIEEEDDEDDEVEVTADQLVVVKPEDESPAKG